MQVSGLAHTPTQGAPVMRVPDSTSVGACKSATEFGEVSKELSSRLLGSDPFVPRWENERLTSSSIGVTYSLRTTTPTVCTTNGSLVSSVAAGTCDLSVVVGASVDGSVDGSVGGFDAGSVGGFDVAHYTFEVVSGVSSIEELFDPETVEQMIPEFLAPIPEPEMEMAISDDVWLDLAESILPAGSNPSDFSMAASVRQVGATFTAQMTVEGLGLSFPLTPVEVSFGDNGVDAPTEDGRLKLSSAKGLTIQPSNFMAGQMVTAMMFSERIDLGSFDPSSEATLSIPVGLAPGNHTLRLVGMAVEGVLLSISVPVVIEETVFASIFSSEASKDETDLVQTEVSKDGTGEKDQIAQVNYARGDEEFPNSVNADNSPSMLPMFTLASRLGMVTVTLLGAIGIGWWFLGSRREREASELLAAIKTHSK